MYAQIDKLLASFFEENKDTNFILFSDHGFGKTPNKLVYINSWLAEKKYLLYKNSILKQVNNKYKKAYYSLGWMLEKRLPVKIYNKIYPILKRNKKVNKTNICIDPTETELFCLNNKKTCAYLSQKWGITLIKQNIKEYEQFREKIINELKNMKDKDEAIFQEVLKKEKIYPTAEKYQEIPDIIFTLNPKYEARAGHNNKFIETPKKPWRVAGSHEFQRKGIFIAYGPDIQEGKRIKDIQIYDIAPTILHIYGVPIPKDMDGRVLMEIFKEKSEPATRNIRYCDDSDANLLNKFAREIRI